MIMTKNDNNNKRTALEVNVEIGQIDAGIDPS